MNLSVSNIAWSAEQDEEMYAFLERHHFAGLEIAPTRLFPQSPYDHLEEAAQFARTLQNRYRLSISSLQSIWYGVSQSIFGSDEDRRFLLGYIRKAALFAQAAKCRNMVFGCPRNRIMSSPDQQSIAIDFFREAGEICFRHGAVLAIEPNPPYYNTNYINTTAEAFSLCRAVDSPGVRVNVDLGTCIHYAEGIGFIAENIGLVNHIHISEPMLAPIEKRPIHKELKSLSYSGWFSVEMSNTGDLQTVQSVIRYIEEALS